MDSSYRQLILIGVMCASVTSVVTVGMTAEPAAPKNKSKIAANASGREIFLREWLPNDPRSHGGDGLGPVFNDTSCVSCHNQGGIGGGGAEAKNVLVITAVRVPQGNKLPFVPPRRRFSNAPGEPIPNPVPVAQTVETKLDLTTEEQLREKLLDELRTLHPGFVTARSVVLHNSSTDPEYAAWRDKTLGVEPMNLTRKNLAVQQFRAETAVATQPATQSGFFKELVAEARKNKILELLPPNDLLAEQGRSLSSRLLGISLNQQPRAVRNAESILAALATRRNSIALFGAGLIDGIPNEVIEAVAMKKHEEFPEISGRVARLKDGKIGRFGWKAQKANLYDFTMTACAVEIGLNVPDQSQASVPHRPEYLATGFDLNREECQDLVQFLRDLPAPRRTDSSSPAIASQLQLGEQAFAKIGCAACHVSDLGNVRGIFSDLLVHDLGAEMGDSGSYGVFQPQSTGNDAEDPLAGLLTVADEASARRTQPGPDIAVLEPEERIPDKMIGAARQEWRTPPLWGVRDSAPYMHDGRAGTLEEAIAFHGGEGQLSANRFFRLPPEEKARVLAFLRSLVAPEQVTAVAR